mmetsp:Transcript_118011/g.176309  ORF Transcript_118011/g.176309 Transcript_118011/m.176309 type:complete len:251 (-) Transcript_118011:55-807(-)
MSGITGCKVGMNHHCCRITSFQQIKNSYRICPMNPLMIRGVWIDDAQMILANCPEVFIRTGLEGCAFVFHIEDVTRFDKGVNSVGIQQELMEGLPAIVLVISRTLFSTIEKQWGITVKRGHIFDSIKIFRPDNCLDDNVLALSKRSLFLKETSFAIFVKRMVEEAIGVFWKRGCKTVADQCKLCGRALRRIGNDGASWRFIVVNVCISLRRSSIPCFRRSLDPLGCTLRIYHEREQNQCQGSERDLLFHA